MNEFLNENVGLFYARDKYENILLINEIGNDNRNNEFTCPICGTIVKPRAIDSEKISPHFYHVVAVEHSTESVLHWWYKNQYLIKGDKFSIVSDGIKYDYVCESTSIEQKYNTSFGIYRPDVVVKTATGEEIFFEYNYTSSKNPDDYTEKWIELDRNVVELNIKTLLSRGEKVFKPIFFNGLVVCKSKSERYGAIERHISEQKISDRIRIKYLNGLLRDILRYNQKQITIDDIVMVIDSMNKDDLIQLPKLIKRLKCNSLLDEYCDYKLKTVSGMLKNILYDNKLSYSEYGWLVTMGYSQKWTKCRGARFNNTIYIKRFSYSKFYNYNRCEYNDVSIGFDVLLLDLNKVKRAIISTVENEVERIRNIEKDRLINHLTSQKQMVRDAIRNKVSLMKFTNIKLSMSSELEIRHRSFDSIYKRVDIEKILRGYNGTGRYKLVERIVTDECESFMIERLKDINCLKHMKKLDDNIFDINKYINELYGFKTRVNTPATYNNTNTQIDIVTNSNLKLLNVNVNQIKDIDTNKKQSTSEIIENIKNLIRNEFNNKNNMNNVLEHINKNYSGNYRNSCEASLIENKLYVSFYKWRKKINCEAFVDEGVFILNYVGKEYKVKTDNYFQAIAMIDYVYNKLK